MLPTGVSSSEAAAAAVAGGGKFHSAAPHGHNGRTQWSLYAGVAYALMLLAGWRFLANFQPPASSAGWQCRNNGKPFVDSRSTAHHPRSQTQIHTPDEDRVHVLTA